MCACSIRRPDSFCASICASSAAAIASKTKTVRKRTPLGTVQLLARADKAGPHIGAVLPRHARQQGEAAVRRILGLLSFTKKYGVARVDEACATALELGVYDYRFVRRYLERNSQPPLSLRQVDPLIRQLTLYRDLIEEPLSKTNQETNE